MTVVFLLISEKYFDMKAIKNIITIVFFGISLVGCYDSDLSSTPTDPDTPRYVYIHFDMEHMATEENSSSEIIHNYIQDGYTVEISGAIAEAYKTINDVDLTKPLELEANGDILVSVHHVDFIQNEVQTAAYYYSDSIKLAAGSIDEFYMDLYLLQGYIKVKTQEGFDKINNKLFVNDVFSNYEEVYYLSSENGIVGVETDGMVLESGQVNKTSEGVEYYVSYDENGNLVIEK